MKLQTPSVFAVLCLMLALGMSLGAEAAKLKCPLCGMNFNDTAKTSFESTKEGKPIHFCSFSCARRFHKKFPDAPLFARDFDLGNRIEADKAHFLIRSDNLLKEIDFDMPPSVVAFSSEAAAKKLQTRLKDGEIVKGYDAVESAFK